MDDNLVQTELSQFEKDMIDGFSQTPKRSSSKYFYDDRGSELFVKIMNMPTYYLTDAEHQILSTKSIEILDHLNFDQPFKVVELGAGDGAKTKELLRGFLGAEKEITYHPVDISQRAMDLLETDLNTDLPELDVQPLVGDYFTVLADMQRDETPALFLFLGSNIGNYENAQAKELLRIFQSHMNTGDYLMIGFDLRKNPHTILAAYNDKEGITRSFSLNLLHRMNRELNTNINVEQFEFYPYYDPARGEMRSCLVSLVEQTIDFPNADKQFKFKANEPVFTELSHKYSLGEIESLAADCGFAFQSHVLDDKAYFSDSIWRKL